jgi:hypothetical protein
MPLLATTSSQGTSPSAAGRRLSRCRAARRTRSMGELLTAIGVRLGGVSVATSGAGGIAI